ncbi:MAG: nucleoside hydrolase [Reichenbachiella sp.]
MTRISNKKIREIIKLIAATYLVLMSLFFVTSCSEPRLKHRIIFDTDFGGDADDLGALAMLNHFQSRGEIELLAVMCWNLEKYSISAIDAVNTYYGNPNIPIGRRLGDFHETSWNHSKVIADNLEHNLTYKNAPDATELYRKLLSESDDKSVVIIAVGPLMNIKKLIDSKADQFSSLEGIDLINSKVKEFVIMGGNFPESKNEWNFDGNMPGVTKYVLEQIDLPITFSGAELGSSIKTGEVFNKLPTNSPLYLGFYHFSKYAPWVKNQFKDEIFDNSTFDQTAVLYAIRNGLGNYWHKVEDGKCIADSVGGNIWVSKNNSNHSYLVLDMEKNEIETELEAFMLGDF